MKRSFSAHVVCGIAGTLAVLSIVPVSADTLELLWSIKAPSGTDPEIPADRDWMTRQEPPTGTAVKGDSVRGMTSNPASGNIVVVSGMANRADDPPLAVRVLDRSSGTELHTLDLTGVTGGTFRLDMVGAADDGAIYAGNLVTGTALTKRAYKIYRWADDQPTTVPTVAFNGDPAGLDPANPANSANPQRWGDSIDVRGAGLNTQIVIAATTINNTTYIPDPVAIFTTSDGLTFTPHLVRNVGSTAGNLSVAFGEDITGYDDPATLENDNLTLTTVYTKRSQQPLRRIGVRTDTWQAVQSTLTVYTDPPIPVSLGSIGVHAASKRLAAIDMLTGADVLRAYDFTDPAAPVVIHQSTVPVNNPNGNGVGSVDFFLPEAGEGTLRIYYLDTNNGLYAFELQPSTSAPVIETPPASLTVIEGGRATLSVIATGGPAPSYQWIKDDVDIPTATSSSYTLAAATIADAGIYKVRVTNSVDTITSDPATLTVTPLVSSDAMNVLWKLAPGDRPYLTTNGNQRGLGYNAELDHLVLVSRTANDAASVVVLEAATGANLGPAGATRTLKLTNTSDPTQSVASGFFVLNMVDCSDDGVVYATNLVTSGTQTPNFKIYSWSNDSGEAEPMNVYGPADLFDRDGAGSDTGDRAGDSFDVRGSGTATQLLVGARNQSKFAILTTTDGLTFTPKVFELTGLTGSEPFAQAAFGEGDTIWARAEAGPLRRVAFDMIAGTAAELQAFSTAEFPGSARVIAADPSTKSFAAIAVETPDNLRLYDITDLTQPPVLLDQELFATDNPNTNFAGSVKFGGGRVYALDTNNGIIAMTLNRAPPTDAMPELIELAYTRGPAGDKFTFVLKGETGETYVLEASPSLLGGSWTDLQAVTMVAPEQPIEFPVAPGQPSYFFRARPQ
ncbi:MAG: immunoglobulin domain-containing protein [Verrucomicrobiales bacterium]